MIRVPDDPRGADLTPLRHLAGVVEGNVWETLAAWRAKGRRLVLLTVVETRGFTPRKAGARMLFAEDGATFGTIGGGTVERVALEAAAAQLRRGEPSRTLHWHLTQELGMCCGGEMSIHLETVESDPRLAVFGAGYIARAVALLALSCGFRVTVVDERPEWADTAAVPGARVVCRDPEAFAREEPLGDRDYAVVVTHEHALDQRVVETLLRGRLRFLGLVGSLPKQRKFALRLRARGFGDADIARVRSPLGVAIGASTPEEIAVSIMGELIAARRGLELDAPMTPPRRHGAAPRDGAASDAPAVASHAPSAAASHAASPREVESR